ncbi:hypothetical protein FC789_15560 [Clostridium botulinum]|uniref:hypothetical protein n=1 Tax=Clostridium sp. M14 TaxID=2716311 RepID=UPI0013EEE277|nr:hypothetical protein [Clostridium sp. M14]MBN1069550.1 hypothetical protein [Clostridium botulinum]MBZ9693518.1 hypothetical protein [Clostridium sp. M14]NFG42548.1 hypothetical protein [Clostridium botulinum]
MKKILFVTDLYYKAKGRLYYDEDLFLTSKLRENFKLVICNPKDMNDFIDDYDLTIFRNAGPVSNFQNEYRLFKEKVKLHNLKTYNSFNGKADMKGKDYLIELTDKNYPVIKTIDNLNYIDKLPIVNKYVIKPKDGADSIGMKFLSKEELYKNINLDDKNTLIQPLINFKYEVSFYFIDKEFQYALYAPDKNKRWELKEYVPTKEDLEFAQKFIQWNNLNHGIQRVDACRTEENELLLVELEDLNPYLSLLEISDELRNKFVDSLKNSLRKVLTSD